VKVEKERLLVNPENLLLGDNIMATIRSGFEQTVQGLTIEKDSEAKLSYTFDWSEWLPQGDSLASADYTITARANDPDPLVKVSQGIQGNKTYIELSDGQLGKSYIVTAKVITVDGLIDRRNFRVKVLARSA
jgi:hypothetical protein